MKRARRASQNAVVEGRARDDQSLVRCLTPMSSAGTPRTAAIAARASARAAPAPVTSAAAAWACSPQKHPKP